MNSHIGSAMAVPFSVLIYVTYSICTFFYGKGFQLFLFFLIGLLWIFQRL